MTVNIFEALQDIQPGIQPSIEAGFEEVGRRKDLKSITEILKQADEGVGSEDLMNQILNNVSEKRQDKALNLVKAQMQKRALKKLGLPEEAANLDSSVVTQLVKNQQAAAKTGQGYVSPEQKQEIGSAIQRVEELVKKKNTGFSLGAFTLEGRKDRAELDTLSEIFVGNLLPLINPRGQISDARMKFIRSLIPNSSDMDATIRGKLDAIKQIFQIERLPVELQRQMENYEKANEELELISPEQMKILDGIFG